MNARVILGIQFGGHDTAAALLVDGVLVAACEQERYDRNKHSRAFPNDAIADCLKIVGLDISKITEIAMVNDPIRHIREFYLRPALHDVDRIGFLINDIERMRSSYGIHERVRREIGYTGTIVNYRHHLCHLASSYYPSGFDEALLVSYDGNAEIETGMIGLGRGGEIQVLHDGNLYPDSLGLLYSAVTHYLGWKHHCDEGIVMGLAPYGDPAATIPGRDRTYRSVFREILRETGAYTFEIDRAWIAYHRVRDTWVSEKFTHWFGPKRTSGEPVTDHHRHIAAALQERLEEVVLSQLGRARKEFGLSRLCLSGGVALNCSLNGKVESSGLFDEIFVQPASGDAGTSIGACYLAYAKTCGLKPRLNHDFYLGSRFGKEEIVQALRDAGLTYRQPENLYAATAERLAAGKIVAWFQNAAEFGPRALGNRSLLVRPYPEDIKDYLNRRVKFREPFRPFAPAVLAEHTRRYFQIRQDAPHMLIASKVLPERRHEIPAVVHVDGTCRVQTVSRRDNAAFRRLLEEFYRVTGCPVLLNTSFNVKGQPIVNTPAEAIQCFIGTNIDVLVLNEYLVERG